MVTLAFSAMFYFLILISFPNPGNMIYIYYKQAIHPQIVNSRITMAIRICACFCSFSLILLLFWIPTRQTCVFLFPQPN